MNKYASDLSFMQLSQLYVIKIDHLVQMIIDIAEFTPKALFFVIEPSLQCQNTIASMIKTSLATKNSRPAII